MGSSTPVTTAGGIAKALAKFDASAHIASSQVFDTGTNVGIGTTAPAAKLDVSRAGLFRGSLTLPTTAAATATVGRNSQPLNLTASALNSGTAQAVNETFRSQAEPVGNNTATPSGKLNLLFGAGSDSECRRRRLALCRERGDKSHCLRIIQNGEHEGIAATGRNADGRDSFTRPADTRTHRSCNCGHLKRSASLR